MIARLRGAVDEKGADWVVIDVGGVGYRLACSARALDALPGPGGAADLRVETMIRDESILLYGFISAAEREAFHLLRSVQGVGPRHALSVLSVLAPSQLATAIAAADKAAVSRADGVGPKLAQRIVNELKDKAVKIGAAPVAAFAPSGAPVAPPTEAGADGPAEDVVSALVNLGYGRSDAFAAVARLQQAKPDAGFDELIRKALQALSG